MQIFVAMHAENLVRFIQSKLCNTFSQVTLHSTLLGVLPSRKSLVANLSDFPSEAEAAFTSIASSKASLTPDSIAGVELVNLTSEPVLAFELQLAIVDDRETIVECWSAGSCRMCLSELFER